MKGSYAKFLAMTKGVISQAETTIKKLGRGALGARNQAQVVIQAHVLDRFLPLVKKVVAQTEERVFRGNRHVVGKVLSLFEPHTVAIRKGKAHKPTEFGRLVRLAEVENGIVSQYEVPAGNLRIATPGSPHWWATSNSSSGHRRWPPEIGAISPRRTSAWRRTWAWRRSPFRPGAAFPESEGSCRSLDGSGVR